MLNDNYKLRYLPLFFDDVNSIKEEENNGIRRVQAE